jgi:hypothetical protein
MSAPLPVELELPFLGARTYLHGTTLFDAMSGYVPAGAALSFKISRRIDSDRVRLQAGSAEGHDASLSWQQQERAGSLSAFARAPSAAVRRDAYDEAQVSGRASAEGDTATLSECSPFGFVQTLIPLFKVLLARKVVPARPGQWMFTRLDLPRIPEPFTPLSLRLSGVVPNRLARARISCAGNDAGEIYFSWVEKA